MQNCSSGNRKFAVAALSAVYAAKPHFPIHIIASTRMIDELEFIRRLHSNGIPHEINNTDQSSGKTFHISN